MNENQPPRCTEHRARFQKGCTPCRARVRWYNSWRRDQIRAGLWEDMVPVEPVRAHIRALLSSGMRLVDIAEVAGISEQYLCNILYVENRQKLTPGVAGAITGVSPRPCRRRLIDATGTHRRLRALCAIGWPFTTIADRLGVSSTTPQHWLLHKLVNRRTAERVQTIYRELAGTPGPSASARKRAAMKGWPPPAAWDDDIDDPNAQPRLDADPDPDFVDEVKVQRALRGEQLHLTDAEVTAALVAGLARGELITPLCDLLHIGRSRAERLLTAAGHPLPGKAVAA